MVDDHEINREVVREMLTLEGVAVETATHGLEALEALSRTRFDAVLMDVRMPVMDGLETTRRLRRELGLVDLPILAMTAGDSGVEHDEALRAGMNDHLTKPIQPDVLAATLARWLSPGDRPPPHPGVVGATRPLDTAAGLELLQGNQEIFRRVLTRFRNAYRDLPERIRLVEASGDLSELGRLAHSLKGTAGHLVAEPLRLAAAELEISARAGRRDPQLVERLLDEVDRVLAALDTLEL